MRPGGNIGGRVVKFPVSVAEHLPFGTMLAYHFQQSYVVSHCFSGQSFFQFKKYELLHLGFADGVLASEMGQQVFVK